MRNLLMAAVGSAALLGFSAPAGAHPNDGDDQHAEQHDELNDEHGDVHQQLNGIHNEAHEEGLSWYEHQQLHRQLGRAHARADGNIEEQHYYQHQNDQYGYGGYNNGYGSPQSYYGTNGYSSYNGYPGYNSGYRFYSRVRHHRYRNNRGY